jgi:ADP-ribose pyrophosphatase YjhB (NUDIX family)
MKRGSPPYIGRWAPPGGFVEANESLEAAAVREVAEEVGIIIDSRQLIPHLLFSIPSINQVYIGFIAILDRMQPLKVCGREALDARWFTLEEWPAEEIWEPATHFDVVKLFTEVRTGQLLLYQWTGEKIRCFGPLTSQT